MQVTEALQAEFNRQMVAVVTKHEAAMAEVNKKLENQLKQVPEPCARAPPLANPPDSVLAAHAPL